MNLDERLLAEIFDGRDPLGGDIPSDRDMGITSDPHTRAESE